MQGNDGNHVFISIHALREEGDCSIMLSQLLSTEISIHALREEGDQQHLDKTGRVLDFNPRPPRGGRRTRLVECLRVRHISIHALREEGDFRH